METRWQFAAICLTGFYVLFVHGVVGSLSVNVEQLNKLSELDRGLEHVRQLTRRFAVAAIYTRSHYDYVRRRRRDVDVDVHPTLSTFTVNAFGKNYDLDLELNAQLLPAGHITRSFKENGEEEVERGAVNCYYQGRLRGEIDSHAVISTCHGLSGSFGIGQAGYWTPDNTFFIEPLTRRPYANGSHFHAVFKVGDTHAYNEERSCGVRSHTHTHSHNDSHHFSEVGDGLVPQVLHSPRAERLRRDVHTETKYVELMIVADNRVYLRQTSNVQTVGDRARAIANFVDTVYKPLNVRVPLVAVEVWNRGDKITVASNPYTTLDNFLAYRRTQLVNKYPHDSGQLITGIDVDGSTVGLAPVGSMCSTLRSGSINQDRSTATNVAGTMAHEMGHTLSMQHDDSSCICTSNTKANGCIMSAVGNGIAPTIWSSCSKNYLRTFLSSGGGSCLFNVPTQLFGTPVCGNGFVETGEQCDCGSAATCNDPCCDAKTCRLSAGSQCSSGECCNNCRFKTAGTQCRASINSCDLPETCSGMSHVCPTNIFLQNGMPCGSGSSASYCYDGMCKTRTQQCTALWGPTTSGTSPGICYSRSNIRGDIYGNCGKTSSGAYIKCSTADVYCGTLFCYGGPSRPLVKNAGYSVVTLSYGSAQCKGVTVSVGQDVPDPGLVEDGTNCGTNSICLMNKCRSISSLGITPCPSSGGKLCSGNGACTNLNRCLCNKGWTGSDCSRADSGPINGGWGQWGLWSICSRTCGSSGTRSRSRQCNNPPPSNGGSPCSGTSSESSTCNRFQCPLPINGGWSQWGAWQSCSKTCGSGTRLRVRTCSNPPPQNGGSACSGLDNMNQACNTQSCGVWLNWGGWSSCSGSCGGTGQQTRRRTCSVANSCSGSSVETTTCMISCVPNIDGKWSTWGGWGSCSVTCGSGTQKRYRLCNMPRPSGTGAQCPGKNEEAQVCSAGSCTPSWNDWNPWQPCSKTCGGGTRFRIRYCKTSDVSLCLSSGGSSIEFQACGTRQCLIAIHGGWTEWTAWRGSCVPCAENTVRVRTRSCTNPKPQNGGRTCSPPTNTQSQPCVCATLSPTILAVSSANARDTASPTTLAVSSANARDTASPTTLAVSSANARDTASPTTPAVSSANASDTAGGRKTGGSSGGSNMGVIVGVVVAVLVVFALVVGVCYWRRRHKDIHYGATSAVDPRSKGTPPKLQALQKSSSNDNLLTVQSSSGMAPKKSAMGSASSMDNLLQNTSRENSPEPVCTTYKSPASKPTGKPPPPPPGGAKSKALQPPATPAYVPPQPSAPPAYVPPQPTAPPMTDGVFQSNAPVKPTKPAPPPPTRPQGTPPTKPLPAQRVPLHPPLPASSASSSPSSGVKGRPDLPSVVPKPQAPTKPHTPAKPQAAPKPQASPKPSASPKPPVSNPPAHKPPSRPAPVLAVKPTLQTSSPPVTGKRALLPPTKAKPGDASKDEKMAELNQKLLQRWPPGSS